MAPPKISSALVGAAGVHFVVSELSLRGLIALPTIRNTAGLDVLVGSEDGAWHGQLQVKTSQSRVTFWPVSKGYQTWQGPNFFYVFVRYIKAQARFEAFLEASTKVAHEVAQAVEESRQRGSKEWTPWWPLPRDPSEQERLRRQWLEFPDIDLGIGSSGQP